MERVRCRWDIETDLHPGLVPPQNPCGCGSPGSSHVERPAVVAIIATLAARVDGPRVKDEPVLGASSWDPNP